MRSLVTLRVRPAKPRLGDARPPLQYLSSSIMYLEHLSYYPSSRQWSDRILSSKGKGFVDLY